MKRYDAIIIGAGQGGSPLAHKLADLEWKVALIEKEHLGGSCINYGCTPTKTMAASARLAHYARLGPDYGVNTGHVTVDLASVVARKNKLVLEWRDGQQYHAENRPSLDLYRGEAHFTGPGSVEVNGEVLSGQRIFINTGTRPHILPIPGLDQVDYLTNRNLMDLTELPEHLLVLGGNYLGLEFGQMFSRFGAKVTVIELMGQIIPREDPDVAETLQAALEDEGISFHLGARATYICRAGDKIAVEFKYKDGSTQKVSGSHLLVAIGRTPNTDMLNLQAAGVETDQAGWIKTNEKLETTTTGIWAIGDVKGGPAFTHISYDDQLVIYDNLINGKNRSIAGRLVPYALFTDPELGRVGMTEQQAREAGYKLKVGSIPMSWVARAIERGETKGMMKIVINAENDRILGATILGIEGGELVQVLMALMMADVPYTIFEKSIFIHPTLVEGFFTLMDNVEQVA